MQFSSPVSVYSSVYFDATLDSRCFHLINSFLCASIYIFNPIFFYVGIVNFFISIVHEGYVAVLNAICVRALPVICFSIRVYQVFSFFISVVFSVFSTFSITFSSSLLWVFFVFSFRLNDETKHFALRRLYHAFVVFCEGHIVGVTAASNNRSL